MADQTNDLKTTTIVADTTGTQTTPTSGPLPSRQGAGAEVQPPLHQARRLAVRRDRLGEARRRHPGLQGQDHLRAEGCGGAGRLVDDGHQHRRQQVPARAGRHAAAREGCARPGLARRREHARLGPGRPATSPSPEDAEIFHAELAHLLLTQKAAFNSPVWFNVGCDRLEPNSDAQNWHWNAHSCAVEFSVTGYQQAAVLGLLHQFGSGFAGQHPDPRQDRGHALQVGIRRWLEPFEHPRLHGNPFGRRHRLRPA